MPHAAAALSTLSFKDQWPNAEDFEKRFFEFLSHLPRPKVFFARLLNKESKEFDEVEKFFRNVVDHAARKAGYERFEMGKEVSREPFLNVEIFQAIYSSSLVIVDLTDLRPDCFTELGYAWGLRKKVIVTARKGTRLPFDSASFPCHFWSPKDADDKRINDLQEFMSKNINRKPIVES